jgi:putative ABC transport system permease protein
MWSTSPKNGGFSIQGGFAGIEDFDSMKILEGRSFNGLDEPQRRKVAVIGKKVREQLFAKDENPLGDDLTINGITFQVIGVYKSLQNGNQQQEETAHLSTERHAALLRSTRSGTGRQLSSSSPSPGCSRARPRASVKIILAQMNKVSPGRQGCVRQLQPAGSTTRCRACSPASSSSAGWWPVGTIFAGAVGVGQHHVDRGEGSGRAR